MKAERKFISCGLAVALSIVAQVAVARPLKTDASKDDAVATQLANQVCAQARAVPAGMPADQYEAMMVFVLSQSGAPNAVHLRALDLVPTLCSLNPAGTTALANARAAAARGATSGTAGLTTGRGLIGGYGAGWNTTIFTAPSIGVGGGSANYRSAAN